MRKEYDFSKGKRGPVIQPDPRKVRITIRLDRDVLEHYKGVIEEAGGGSYQALINNVLREHMSQQTGVLEETLRKIIREELDKGR